MADQLADIRARKHAQYLERSGDVAKPAVRNLVNPGPGQVLTSQGAAFPSENRLVELSEVDVIIEFIGPDLVKEPLHFSINPVFPLKVALGKICKDHKLDYKKARLWHLRPNQDELVDLEKTPEESNITTNTRLLVEIRRADGQWLKESTPRNVIDPNVLGEVVKKFNEGVRDAKGSNDPFSVNSFSAAKRMQSPGRTAFTDDGRGYNLFEHQDDYGADTPPSKKIKLDKESMEVDDDVELKMALEMSMATALKDEEKYQTLEAVLASKGLKIATMQNDGNCLFSSVSVQVFGSTLDHPSLRTMAVSEMREHPEKYLPFITEDFDVYLVKMSLDGEYGTHLEIQALADVLERPIEIYSDMDAQAGKGEFLSVVGAQIGNSPIRLSYHRGNHYNAVVPISS